MSKPKKGKRFVYGLETVLKVRDIFEAQSREKLKQRERELHEERLKEQKVKKEQQDHLNYVNELLTDELPPLNTIQMHQAHVKTMEERVSQQEEEVKKSSKKRDDQRDDLIQKAKDKKIIEKDKEKTRDAWHKMMTKLDNQFLDELASIKFATEMRKKDEEDEEDEEEDEVS